jgi:FAD/FMN-containing dehydrogenase
MRGFQALRSRFRGALLQPGEEGYDEARRVWNGAIDRRPALIARCAGADDVAVAVRFAREHGLPVSVRGGGHAVAGHAVVDGGLMIDLSAMKAIRVDPGARTARAAGGVLLGELDRATQRFGLATPSGIVSHTGIGGLTLGGGLGHTMRKFGLTVDNLRSVDLVTAEGEPLHVDAWTEPELFWGLRGGGGNFGIATTFEYRLHPVVPLRQAATPIADNFRPLPYLALQSLTDGGSQHGMHYYWRSQRVPVLADEVIDVVCGLTDTITSPLSYAAGFVMGGTAGQVDPDATAVGERGDGFELSIVAAWPPPDPGGDRHTTWVRQGWADLRPHSTGVYSHFLSDEGAGGVEAAYGDRLKRLTALKDRYDPENVFRMNANIPPSGGG